MEAPECESSLARCAVRKESQCQAHFGTGGKGEAAELGEAAREGESSGQVASATSHLLDRPSEPVVDTVFSSRAHLHDDCANTN